MSANPIGTHSLSRTDIKILIVDDHEDSLLYAKYAGELFGYQVTVCESGDNIVQTVLSCAPDVIFLDLYLVGTTGHEALRQLKACQQTQKIPVIAATAMVTEPVRKQCLNAGFADFLAKPYTIEEFEATVCRHSACKSDTACQSDTKASKAA